MTTALQQRNYAAGNIAKGLCAQCTNSLSSRSKRFCLRHLELKRQRSRKPASVQVTQRWRQQWYEKLKCEVIRLGGGKCVCCGGRLYGSS